MKALIVDDSPLTRLVLADYLTEIGFEVFEAGNHEEAVSLFDQIHPEIIIKDLFMSGWDIIDSIRYFRTQDANVKILICSTESSKSEIVASLKAGAHDFLVKPLSKTQVVTTIHRLTFSREQIS